MPGVDLYWIPLGAGTRAVRLGGRLYERLAAWREHRRPQALYHSALVVTTSDARFTIEMAPIPDADGREKRGVVAEGPVGLRVLGRFRVFRYEIRRWRDGVIPDLPFAVASPVHLTSDADAVEHVLRLVPDVPVPVWGLDDRHAGEMWNSNSVVAWILARAELTIGAGAPPLGGRAPGWRAGLVEAARGCVVAG